MNNVIELRLCAACGKRAEGNYAIERHSWAAQLADENLEYSEVDLCDDCGSSTTPTCEELWAMIAARGVEVRT